MGLRIGGMQSEPSTSPGMIGRLALAAGALAIGYLAVRVSLAGLVSAAGWAPLPLDLELLDERLPVIFRAHMVLAAFALLLIVAALAARRLVPRWHRPIGRAAAIAVILGGLTALPSAVMSVASPAARAGFFVQALVWLALLGAGWRAIRRGERHRHMRLMIAMAAVASGAIWVRLALWAVAASGVPLGDAYAAIAWAGWLVPLAIALALTRPPAAVTV